MQIKLKLDQTSLLFAAQRLIFGVSIVAFRWVVVVLSLPNIAILIGSVT
jgi:hypothetical protein